MDSKTAYKLPWFTMAILPALCAVLYIFSNNHGIVLIALSLASIGLIIFGEHFALDDMLESHHIPGRDAIIPLIALGIALALGAVSPDTLPRVFRKKIDIICLILSFAIVSEGIARSGYFAFAANKIVSKCHGNTTRLVIYMYILTSTLAFFTSNDIVILVLTPVIISICVHARIHNARLILLSQFVAANTMSMGTLIGSPTNIIFGNAMHMNFITYFLMMVVPALFCGALSLIVIDWVNRQSRPGTNGIFAKRWGYEDTYRIPASAHYVHFSPSMKTWLVFFVFAVALLAVVSSLHISLFWAAIPISLASLYSLYRGKYAENKSTQDASDDMRRIIGYLPYSILFFSMTFFIFSDELVRLGVMQNIVLPFMRDHFMNDVVHASFSMLLMTGGLVNTINDLPAAAFMTDTLLHINAMSNGPLNEYMQMVVMQAILIGLNIGCYVTPIGALAGIMWFNIIRREERRQTARERMATSHHAMPGQTPVQKMLTPSRGDLLRYGLMHFAFISFVMGYLLPFFVHMIDVVVSSPGHADETALPGLLSLGNYIGYIGFGMLAFILFSIRKILIKSGVLLSHVREVFIVMTRVTIWTMKNRLLYLIMLGAVLLALASGLLYWAETTHEHIFGITEGSKPLFDSLSSFFIWVMVFSGAGLSDSYKPHSALGMALTSILPVLVIGGIVLISQLSTKNTIQQLSRKMASGDIPGYRIVIINFHSGFEKFVEIMLHNNRATILLLCNPMHYDRAVAYCNKLDAIPSVAFRVYAALKHADAAHSIDEFRIDHADEIYLLSDMTVLGEYDKIRYATKLDYALNTIRSAIVENMDTDTVEDYEKAQKQDIDHLEGVPKIFVESCAERFHGLMQKASSSLFLHTTIQTTFDRDNIDLLMSDMDESLISLNHYYRLGETMPMPHLFEGSILSGAILRAFDLEDTGKEIFCQHFSGPLMHDDMTEAQAEALMMRQSSMFTRALVGEKTRSAHYFDGYDLKKINDAELFGVIADVAGSKIHLSVPSAALSMQPVNVEKIILKHPASAKTYTAEACLIAAAPQHRIFIFNLSQLSRAFVRQLLPLYAHETEPRIILLCAPTQFVPEDIKNSSCVHILKSDFIESTVQKICPSLAERREPGFLKSKEFRPLLQQGDRLYGFMEHDAQNPEASTIDFMDLLSTRLQRLVQDAAQEGMEAPISHPNIYIAMEAIGADSRFMMKNFYIDKIIDTSLPRTNYLEIFATLFHRLSAEKSLLGDIGNTVYNFHQASEIAAYLCHFTVMLAEDIRLKNDLGTEINIIAQTMEEAIVDIRAYSSPPMQLFGRVRVTAKPYSAGGHTGRTFCLVPVDDGEPIRKGDLLLNVPII